MHRASDPELIVPTSKMRSGWRVVPNTNGAASTSMSVFLLPHPLLSFYGLH